MCSHASYEEYTRGLAMIYRECVCVTETPVGVGRLQY
jgi:hypothetical protein